ncbi:Nn.00g003150.m01.CDS01 [Neocucurbitaria sp. VM-36]
MKSTLIIASLIAAAFSAPTLSHSRRQAGGNFQTFSAALGGIEATPVVDSGDAKRPFQVKGDTFVNIGAALQRSCDQQFNACANAANGGDKTLSVGACSDQKTQCDASAQTSTAAANTNAQAGGSGNANGNGNANANANGNANGNATESATANGNANGKKGASSACTKKRSSKAVLSKEIKH